MADKMAAPMSGQNCDVFSEDFVANLPHGSRKFYEIPSSVGESSVETIDKENLCDLSAYIEENVVGKDKIFSGPFGQRSVVYCDYTASGRSLSFIEDYIRNEVLPEYGNTHTTTTVTSLQTTLFRHEARDIVRNAVHASEHDAVIFIGNGCTGAVHKLIHALAFSSPPVVFVGPYEHHSNLLPWKEIGADVIRITATENGLVDLECLTSELKQWKSSGRELLGCFSAASNVTGILADVHDITVCLHKHGALAFWDYATAGPYVDIDMNPVVVSDDQPHAYIDAIYMSPHKFVGGVSTPGILVAKKRLFRNPVPSGGGGGSIFFVRRDQHRYLQEAEMREEGGTPAIVESIRAGLVFNLKEAVTAQVIMEREHRICNKVFDRWKDVPNLVILGSTTVRRLPIFSFLIRHPESGLFLHHNYICTILNDVFGIQARGGCACAGPYALDLLGIDEEMAKKIENLLVEDGRLDRTHLRRYREYSEREILRPGFARLNFPFFMNENDVDFVIDAVKMVAEVGWKLLPQYLFNPETGEWRHRKHQVFKDRKWLSYISYSSGRMTYQDPVPNIKGPLPVDRQDCLGKATEIFSSASKMRVELSDQTILFDDRASEIRWFLLPSEAQLWLTKPRQAAQKPKHALPFHPGKIVSHPSHVYRSRKVECQGGCGTAQTTPFEGSEISDSNPGMQETFSDLLSNYLTGGFVGVTGASSSEQTTSKFEQKSLKPPQTSLASEQNLLTSVPDSTFQPNSLTFEQKTVRSPQNSVERPSEQPSMNSENFQQTTKSECSISESAPKNSLTIEQKSDTFTNAGASFEGNGKGDNSLTESERSASTDSSEAAPHNADDANSKLSAERTNGGNGENLNSLETSVTSNDAACDKVPAGVPSARDPASACLECVPKNSGAACPSKKVNAAVLKWYPPPKVIFTPTIEALEEYQMIQNGDKVLVCLSGGKDSLSLLHTLRQYQFYAKKKGVTFDLGAVTVDPGTSSYDPSPLKGYLKALNVPYFYEEQCILEQAANLPYECASICSFCSRMKRGRIYAAARREGYNVLAMGQHLDDLAESFLMNSFHNGGLRTMKANYTVKEGDLRVIRPFVYAREKDLRQFAEEKKLPVIAENCPACFEAPKERHRMKQLLATQELLFPNIFSSLMAAMKPLMALDRTGSLFETDGAGKNGETNEDDVDL